MNKRQAKKQAKKKAEKKRLEFEQRQAEALERIKAAIKPFGVAMSNIANAFCNLGRALQNIDWEKAMQNKLDEIADNLNNELDEGVDQ